MVDDETRARIAFLGESLAPFFLNDPSNEHARPSFDALAALDARAAGAEWPFADDAAATRDLAAMSDSVRDGIADDLIWEYRRLFVGPGKKPAPPWGSVYTDRECVVFGESTLALRRWMRSHGIERQSDERTPEDHIGLMLALLGWLAREKPALMEDYAANHLLTWSSHYLDQLEHAAAHPFYAALAHLTRISLEGMQRDLGLAVSYPKFYR